jgi:hypothetical protein
MGASGWHYFVPYQPDLNKALQELRQRVFEQGHYYKPAEFYEAILDIQPEPLQEKLKESIEEFRSHPEPKSIEELLQQSGESGTHSIVDIQGISAEPDYGFASPLSGEQLIGLFGTNRPTHAMVAGWDWGPVITKYRHRYQGLYIVVYKDEQPNEIFFCGFSGD